MTEWKTDWSGEWMKTIEGLAGLEAREERVGVQPAGWVWSHVESEGMAFTEYDWGSQYGCWVTDSDLATCKCSKNMGGGWGLGSNVREKSSFGFGQTGLGMSLSQPGGNVKSTVSQPSSNYCSLRSLLKSIFFLISLPPWNFNAPAILCIYLYTVYSSMP